MLQRNEPSAVRLPQRGGNELGIRVDYGTIQPAAQHPGRREVCLLMTLIGWGQTIMFIVCPFGIGPCGSYAAATSSSPDDAIRPANSAACGAHVRRHTRPR